MKAYDENKWTVGQIAERFKVGEWWVYKLKRQRQNRIGIASRKGKVGQPQRFDAEQINRLTQYMDQQLNGHAGTDPRPASLGSAAPW